jgi:hypothetical protein
LTKQMVLLEHRSGPTPRIPLVARGDRLAIASFLLSVSRK